MTAVTFDVGAAPKRVPVRSRMLDMFMGDIARMLASGEYESARKTALGIPHIGVALADPNLHSSREAYLNWCAQWVHPALEDSICEASCVRADECDGGTAQGVPFSALRALRLRRLARELPLPSLERSLAGASPERTDEEVAHALLGAMHRWYVQEGRYQPTVQTNLARLGVLR